jgi:hypothetical protein
LRTRHGACAGERNRSIPRAGAAFLQPLLRQRPGRDQHGRRGHARHRGQHPRHAGRARHAAAISVHVEVHQPANAADVRPRPRLPGRKGVLHLLFDDRDGTGDRHRVGDALPRPPRLCQPDAAAHPPAHYVRRENRGLARLPDRLLRGHQRLLARDVPSGSPPKGTVVEPDPLCPLSHRQHPGGEHLRVLLLCRRARDLDERAGIPRLPARLALCAVRAGGPADPDVSPLRANCVRVTTGRSHQPRRGLCLSAALVSRTLSDAIGLDQSRVPGVGRDRAHGRRVWTTAGALATVPPELQEACHPVARKRG